jgi:hypothetical protein
MRFRGNRASLLALDTLGFLATFLLAACAGTKPVSEIRPPGSHLTVYVVHHGALHTGLAVKRSDIPRSHWPASADFAHAKYIEVGWGDDDGYRKPLTSGITTKALLGDRQTVLLADGFSQSPARKFGDPKFTVLAVGLSEAGFTQLCDHI